MASKSFENVPPTVPSYEETMNGTTPQLYPNVMSMPMPMPMQSYPQTVQPTTPQPQVHNMHPVVNNIHIGGLASTCSSCRQPLHTRVGYVSTCTTHCAFLFCCLFLCVLCAPFVYCTKTCREPRLFCVNCGARV